MDANPIVLDESADDVVVVVVEGEHDIYTAPTLRERLDEALERGGGVVVDLTAATFVDSSVLGALLDARRRALDADQGYVVCVGEQVEPGVQRILDITGLVPVLPVVGDRALGDRARARRGPRMTVAVVPEVRLTMPARAEGVGVVRQALAGMADALAFNAAVVADMKMAVTEACTNVVVHAYDGEEGTLEVEMLADDSSLTIVVRDWGTGIQPRPQRREAPALGLGLPLIAALSDSFELRGSTNSGAEVRMTFIADRAADPAAANPVTGSVGDDGRWDPRGRARRPRRPGAAPRARACGRGGRARVTRSGARAPA